MSKHSKRLKVAKLSIPLSVLFSASMPIICQADEGIGGTRAAGMGGAGLALPIDIAQNHRLNPAMLGLASSRFSFEYPNFGYHLDGFNISDLQSKFGNLGNGGLTNSQLTTVAQDFGESRKEVGINLGIGAEYAAFAVDMTGSANITTIPNALLEQDVRSGTAASNFNANDQLDAYGLTAYEVGASYGKVLQTTTGEVSVGTTLNYAGAYYSHQYVSGTTISSGGNATPGTELNGANYLNQSGVGLDVGALYDAGKNSNVYYGLTVTNLIEPNISFSRTTPVTSGGVTTEVTDSNVEPFKRSVNVGVGGIVEKKILLAGDIYDVGNNTGSQQLRLGGEYSFGSGLALRGGYNSLTGFTVGFSVLGINVAYASNSLLTVATAYRF